MTNEDKKWAIEFLTKEMCDCITSAQRHCYDNPQRRFELSQKANKYDRVIRLIKEMKLK